MLLHHCFDIKQSQAVALDIVQIAGGDAIEFVIDVWQFIGSDAHTMVGDTNGTGRGINLNTGLTRRILDGIVDEVIQYVAQVSTVGLHGQVFRLDMGREGYGFIGLQLLLLNDGLQ